MVRDARKIDAFCWLHFQDRVDPMGGEEDFVATVDKTALSEVRALEGVKVEALSDDTGGRSVTVAVRAGRKGRANLIAAPGVKTLLATARRNRLPVLVQFKRPDLVLDIEGFEKGSMLGSIMSAMADENALQALAEDPNVIAVEVSSGGVADCSHSMPWIGVPAAQAPPFSEKGNGSIVALIDAGLDVLHEAFHDATGASRVLYLWDQAGSGPSPKTKLPQLFSQSYGTLHTQADISGYIAAGALGKGLTPDYGGHGTHVASIATGTPLPAVGFPGGVAPESDIVAVIPKLYASDGNPQSLGYSKSHVDALAFIRTVAEDARLPVAVNVSLGMNAGSHDGTSLLELAFDAFSGGGRDPGFVVIKSAGNEFGFGGHAHVQTFQGGVIPICWTTKAIARQKDSFEFWFSASDDLKFTLIAPAGLACSVDWRTTEAAAFGPQFSIHLNLTRFHIDNGDSRLVILVQNSANAPISIAGDWRLEILGNVVLSDGSVHGWVERDDSRAVEFSTGSINELTLSIPGTARTVISVGACAPNDPLTLSASSSRGPTRDLRRKPELVAPGVEIVAAEAGSGNGLVSMTGTSMAAPHVTGAIALLLARRARTGEPQLNAAQIRAALAQSVRGYTGRWQPGFGNGRLDVKRLLEAFG